MSETKLEKVKEGDKELSASSLMYTMFRYGAPENLIRRHRDALTAIAEVSKRAPSEFRANGVVFQIVYKGPVNMAVISFSKLCGQIQMIFNDKVTADTSFARLRDDLEAAFHWLDKPSASDNEK